MKTSNNNNKGRRPAVRGKLGKMKKGPKSRKDVRKEERTAKKIKKQHHTESKSKQGNKTPLTPAVQEDNIASLKKIVPGKQIPSASGKKSNKKFGKSEDKERNSFKAEKNKLEKDMKQRRGEQLKQANEEEDKNIKQLEKLMKMNKRKSKKLPRAFVDEGLDCILFTPNFLFFFSWFLNYGNILNVWLIDLLEVCDPERMISMKQNPAMVESSDSEFEDDIAQATGKKVLKKKKYKSIESDENSDQSEGEDEEISTDEEKEIIGDEKGTDMEDDEDVDDEMGSMEEDFSEDEIEEPKSKSSSNKRVQFQDEVESEQSSSIKKRKVDPINESAKDEVEEDDESLEGEGSVENLEGEIEKVAKRGELWEDIYGRTRDKKGNVVEVNSLINSIHMANCKHIFLGCNCWKVCAASFAWRVNELSKACSIEKTDARVVEQSGREQHGQRDLSNWANHLGQQPRRFKWGSGTTATRSCYRRLRHST